MYLLTDIPGVEPYGLQAKYEKGLESLVRQLALSSLPDTMFGRSLRRRVLSDIMLEISQQLFGGTQVRLTIAFGLWVLWMRRYDQPKAGNGGSGRSPVIIWD